MTLMMWIGNRGIPLMMFGLCVFAAGLGWFVSWPAGLYTTFVFGILAGLFLFIAEFFGDKP